jgi:hypothetical protein
MRGPRRDVDYLPGTSCKHERADRARAQQCLGQVDVNDEPQFVVGDAGGAVRVVRQRDQWLADGITKTVHQHIDASERGEHRIDSTSNLVRLGHIGDDGNDASS